MVLTDDFAWVLVSASFLFFILNQGRLLAMGLAFVHFLCFCALFLC